MRNVRTGAALAKLVVFAVVTILATGVLAATIANLRFVPQKQYQAVFSDVTGLLPGDDVRVAGVRVGQVQAIRVKDRSLAEVVFKVDDSVPLRTSTEVLVRYRNLIGQRYLALSEGPGGTPLRPGATIPLAQTRPALDLTVLFNGFKPLFAALSPKEVNDFAYEIIKTLQGEGGTVTSLLTRTASLTQTLADRDAVIGRVVDNLNQVLGTVDQRDQRLSELIVQLQRFMSGLAADRQAIGAALGSIADLTTQTADLLGQSRPALQQDIAKLGEVSATLDQNKATVDKFLKTWPDKVNAITRTATYGSWFNFYLCSFDGTVLVSVAGQVQTTSIPAGGGRCQG